MEFRYCPFIEFDQPYMEGGARYGQLINQVAQEIFNSVEIWASYTSRLVHNKHKIHSFHITRYCKQCNMGNLDLYYFWIRRLNV